MPNPNQTVYKTYPSTGRGTINTGTTLNVNFGTLRIGVSILISNFDTSNVFEVALNDVSNDRITVPSGRSLVFNDEKIQKIFLINNSGSAILYQVLILGG